MNPLIRDKCAVFGIYSLDKRAEIAKSIYYGLLSLQHRGQESAGIATYDGAQIYLGKSMGLVADVFPEEELKKFIGYTGIGHVRYSTTGESRLENAHPQLVDGKRGRLAIVHNGNLVNYSQLRKELELKGCKFQTTTDTEVIGLAIAMEEGDLTQAISRTMEKLEGSYSFIILTDKGEFAAVRDPFGFRPLCYGEDGKKFIFASETVAFDIVDASYVRDVEPGEIVVVNESGLQSNRPIKLTRTAYCMFEYVYFSRPDSILNGKSVYETRRKIGELLAQEHPVEADVIIPVPDSARPHSEGYASINRLPIVEGLVKNRYIGRTFIMPYQKARELLVRAKLNPVRSILKDRRVVLLDDSIVRGTTSKSIVELLKKAGAKEVHVRIGCPPIKSPCFYGIDMPTREELIASRRTIPTIASEINADSLGYLSIENLIQAIGFSKDELCLACLTGEYPTQIAAIKAEAQIANQVVVE
ncbi:MAG: amidophosphoribosyltransferase [Euryarchaeota archaeon]|nr:amidophosphoribosyltransferase [Euryarchaeota archaeon]